MTDFFKKNENTEPESVVLYYDIFMDMIKEIEENYLATIANSDNIYNIEYMTNSFLYEWLSFYGVEFQENQFENFNRNALKRWKAFLRTRGEEQTLMSVLSSGGSLFGYSKYKIWIYWWDNVPKWVEANPQDGYIYVVCQNREVIKTNDLIDSVKPAGYCFDILYRNDSIPIYPYYGDLRYGYGVPEEHYCYLPKNLAFDAGEIESLYSHLSYINNITVEQVEQYVASKVDTHGDKTLENISLGISSDSQPIVFDAGMLQRLEERWSSIQSDLYFTMDSWLESVSWPVSVQSDYPTEYQLYKSNASERGYETDEEIYGNWGSFDYEKVSGLTLDSNGFFGGYTPISVPAGYPSPFQTVDVITGDGRKSLSAEDLVSKFQQCVQFDYNAETGEFDIPVGHISNRTTVITRDLGYDINNGYVYDDYGTKSDGTIDEHITNIDDYVYEVVGFYKSNALGIETWRSDSSYTGIASARSFCLDIPFDTRKDGKVNFRFCLSSTSSPENQGIIEIYVNDRKVKLIYGGDVSYNEWHLYTCSVSEDIGLYPRSTIKIVYSRWSENEALDIDLSNICLRESLVWSDRAISTENDVIAKEDIVFHRNWSFETLYRNNLSMETLYYQYNNSPTLLDATITPSKKSTGQQDGLYKWVMVSEDGIDCLGTDRSYIYTGTGLVAAGCDFYFELPEEKTLSFRLKHVTNSSRFFAAYIDGTAVANRVYSQNTTQSSWFTITHTFSAGSHFIIFRNIASTESAGSPSANYAIVDLTEFKKYIFPFTRYNPPEIGIQPVKYPDGVYKYIPKGTAPISGMNATSIISEANGLTQQEASGVVDEYFTSPTTVDDNMSLLGHLSPVDNSWVADTLDASNYVAYNNAIQQYWNNSEIEPSESTEWPPEEPVQADLLTGLAYHYGFGTVGSASWTSDGGIGGTLELNSRSSATGGITGKIDGGVSFSDGAGKAYRNVAAETVDGHLLVFGRKNTDWSAAVWLKGIDSADTNDGRRAALSLLATSGAGYVVTLGTSDGGLPALLYGFPPTAPLVEGVSDILDGNWHLLIATHDTEAEEVAFYCDGQLVGTSGDSSLYTGTSGVTPPFFVGRSNWSAVALCLVGDVDEVALWHGRAIGQAEATSLWNNGDGLPFEDWT